MKIGLVPMAAKPYHAGHHALVKKASTENELVLLYTNVTSNRERAGEFPITGKQMKEIWEKHIANIIPENVTIHYVASPVRSVYEELAEANSALDSSTVYSVYSDPVDTAGNYPMHMRMKHFPELVLNELVIFPAEEDSSALRRGGGMPNISGTRMREYLQDEKFEEFAGNLPAGLDAIKVWNILKNQVYNEHLLRACVKSFIAG